MNDKFFDLKKEKQDRIINAAMKVFALNGYRNASTDDIVKEAGISKGLLFHYFENKIGVYTFLFDYSARYTTLELKSNVDSDITDVFELMRQIEFSKLLTIRSHPYMQMFLKSCMKEDIFEALMAIEERRTQLSELYDSIYMQIDPDNLNEDANIDIILGLIRFTVDGLMDRYFREDGFGTTEFYEEVKNYIGMLEKLCKKAV
ncbi:MAG: TetR/AcrR family transcriptional regulator [Lachnospiraceae bacterium]|nr:TetR/AcrR family transcriptional regulator [Lachnospiraceae bacterium]MBR4994013.1 TetR/AcrR family transcriptional regulator [Lachnospiraceae bacterium]MBR5943506.1 TetR/AcrR family transcriptional regulator [Lachnospiraceae bacterium]